MNRLLPPLLLAALPLAALSLAPRPAVAQQQPSTVTIPGLGGAPGATVQLAPAQAQPAETAQYGIVVGTDLVRITAGPETLICPLTPVTRGMAEEIGAQMAQEKAAGGSGYEIDLSEDDGVMRVAATSDSLRSRVKFWLYDGIGCMLRQQER
ncbi:MAG TPA: hypothetical protein VEH84_11795 [Alphaproteobacteria bacterium]|nr:hypothetical protein [Alphaproteobacteria bacterium]